MGFAIRLSDSQEGGRRVSAGRNGVAVTFVIRIRASFLSRHRERPGRSALSSRRGRSQAPARRQLIAQGSVTSVTAVGHGSISPGFSPAGKGEGRSTLLLISTRRPASAASMTPIITSSTW